MEPQPHNTSAIHTYMICLVGFFHFEWVYIFHDSMIICLKKERCQRQTVRVMVSTNGWAIKNDTFRILTIFPLFSIAETWGFFKRFLVEFSTKAYRRFYCKRSYWRILRGRLQDTKVVHFQIFIPFFLFLKRYLCVISTK
jgi:hypothetical protein